MTHPNTLFLMSDEHRYDLAGFAGNDIVRTPVLDELARTGAVFDNCYAPSPICAPSRQCMMAGQLPKTCHVDGAWMDLAPRYHTFARRFGQHAYKTVCAGKLHHLTDDQMQGWQIRLNPDAYIMDKFYDGLIREEYESYISGPNQVKTTDEMIVKSAAAGEGRGQRFDRRSVEDLESYIQKSCSAKAKRPHLLKLSLVQPHYPYNTEPERYDYYYDKVPIFEEAPCDHPVLQYSQDNRPVHVSAEEIRRATATYYGMTEAIDTCYGRIMQALEAQGHDLDEWIIVYVSDHGEMLGEHGIWEKSRFYEGSVRAPMIIRFPKKIQGGTRVSQNVNLCDLFATLCDLAEIPCQPGLDSRTLVPLMNGNAAAWRNESVSQIRRGKEDHVMIKQDDLKYQYYGQEIPEVLFDLATDPHEDNNCIDDPSYADRVSAFRARLSELGYGPDADSGYTNAAYVSGVTETDPASGCLWPPDVNPWDA